MSNGIHDANVERALKDFRSQIENLIEQYVVETKLLYESTSVEKFCYCSYCYEDLYAKGLDDESIKKMRYCPYCGAKIART